MVSLINYNSKTFWFLQDAYGSILKSRRTDSQFRGFSWNREVLFILQIVEGYGQTESCAASTITWLTDTSAGDTAMNHFRLQTITCFWKSFNTVQPLQSGGQIRIFNIFVILLAFIIWQGSLGINPGVLVLSWSGFCHTDRFHGNGQKMCIFCLRKPAISKQALPECHIINYLLT